MRKSLVAALVECADGPLKSKARRFLTGLSCDELQFIAEFLGSCILESQVRGARNRAELAEKIASIQLTRADCGHDCGHDRGWMRSTDRELKMILLLEYLCRSGIQELSIPARADSPTVN